MKDLPKLKELSKTARTFVDSILFTSFDDSQRTPLTGADSDDKEDMLDFINSSIDDYGKPIFKVFTDISVTNPFIASVDDIFEEGVLIRYLPANAVAQSSANEIDEKQINQLTKKIGKNPDSATLFIPFRTKKGGAYQRLYMLGAEAQIKLGIFDDIVKLLMPVNTQKHAFSVTKTQFVSKNMIRIYIKSETALPQNAPGYAYRFALSQSSGSHNKTTKLKVSSDLLEMPIQLWQQVEPKLINLPYGEKVIHNAKKYALLTALEVFKRLPDSNQSKQQSKQKQSDQEQTEQDSVQKQPEQQSSLISEAEKRYYTLRQLKSNTDPFTGEVDIYIHGATPGSIWAKSLQVGDKIKIDNEYEETIKDMIVGQPLLICDETSMPSVAAVLEQWQIDTVPIVISITNDKEDFTYFDDMVLPEQLQNKLSIEYINASKSDNLADTVIEVIKQQDKKIDCAWGAIGKADFRAIKKYLREEHELTGKLNRVRAYWV